MKKLFQMSLLLLLISSAVAQESSSQQSVPQPTPKTLRVYDWKDLAQQHQLSVGDVISVDGMSVLKIESTNDTPQEITLLKISDASVIKKANSIYGEFKCENVQSPQSVSNLKMVTYIPPAAPGGDTTTSQQIGSPFSGSSNWRPYRFIVVRGKTLDGRPKLPTQLEVRLVLAGRGTVYLRPIKVLGVTGSWWSTEQSGLIGGIGGSVIGCFGALIGILASKGKARKFVLTSIQISIVVGILLMIAGLVALVYKQPYAVWYALLLPGVILTSVFSLNLSSLQRRYDELEIRRMTSVDTLGS